MSAPTTKPREYPVPCPKCDEAKGYPYQVRTIIDRAGSIEVRLRCRDCLYEWVEVTPPNE